MHQGCIYDDQGGGIQYRWFFDTLQRNYTYPEAVKYRRNAADIVESGSSRSTTSPPSGSR